MRTLLLLSLLTVIVAIVVAEDVSFKLSIHVKDARGQQLIGLAGDQPVVTISYLINDTKREENRICGPEGCLFNITLPNATAFIGINITVSWLGVRLHKESYFLNVDELINRSIVTKVVKINSSTVRIVGTNDNDEELKNCEVYVNGLNVPIKNLKIDCGKYISLPFGNYNTSSSTYRIANTLVNVHPLSGRFEVINGTSNVKIRLGIVNVFVVDLRKADGSPLLGSEVQLKFHDAGNVTVYGGTVQALPLHLRDLPYGQYFIEVRWKGVQLIGTKVTVGSLSRSVNLSTNLIPKVNLMVVDKDLKPVVNSRLRITGSALNVETVTDENGCAVVYNVIPSSYMLTSYWKNYSLNTSVHIGSSEARVELPLWRPEIKVSTVLECSERCRLPPNLTVELLYGEDIIVKTSTLDAVESLSVSSENPVYVQVYLKLRVTLNKTLLYERIVWAGERSYSVKLPFFDLSIEVKDHSGDPLPDAIIIVEDKLGKRKTVSDYSGIVELPFLYGNQVNIEVLWGNVSVARKTTQATVEPFTIISTVYPLKVEVKGVLGQPVSDAIIFVQIRGPGYDFKRIVTTRDDGVTEILIPAPPGSTVSLAIHKGRISLERQLLSEEVREGYTVITLDLLVDFGWLQIRTSEAVAMFTATIILMITIFVIVKIQKNKEIRRDIFKMYGVPLEEEEKKSFLEIVRDRFRETFGAEEEEAESEGENGGLFEEF